MCSELMQVPSPETSVLSRIFDAGPVGFKDARMTRISMNSVDQERTYEDIDKSALRE